MLRIATILFIYLLTLPNYAFALGTSPWTKVTMLDQGLGNNPVFWLQDPGNAGTGCQDNRYIRFEDANSESGKRLIAALLAALTTQLEVQVRTDRCFRDNPAVQEIIIRRHQ